MPDAPSVRRESLFDVARGLLVLLVAAGHALEPLVTREPVARGLYFAIYAFHIPAFAALSGHLSRASWSRSSLRAAAWTLLAPLAVFQAAYVALDVLARDVPWTWRFLVRPNWLLWFLLSLFLWRLLLPALVRLRHPFAWSVVLALAAGAVPWLGYDLALSRTLVFLPFFVAGHLVPRARVAALRTRRARALAIVPFVALALLVAAFATGAMKGGDTRLLYGSTGYAAMGLPTASGVAARAALLAFSLACVAAFFAWAPVRPAWLARFGSTSLAPYLLHGLALRAAELAGLPAHLQGTTGTLLAAAVGLALALVLGSRPVVAVTRPLWNPASIGNRQPAAAARSRPEP